MILNGKKYIYIGYISDAHGNKGKVVLHLRRHISPQRIPPRIFIKKNYGYLGEFRIKFLKRFRKNELILKLNKVKDKNSALELVSSDVYIFEGDLPRNVRVEIGVIPPFIPEAKDVPEKLEEIGFITKPRGLQGAVAVVSPKDKEKIWSPGLKVYIEGEKGNFYSTEVRAVKKLRQMQDNIYLSVKFMFINDLDSAEKLRKRKIFVSAQQN